MSCVAIEENSILIESNLLRTGQTIDLEFTSGPKSLFEICIRRFRFYVNKIVELPIDLRSTHT